MTIQLATRLPLLPRDASSKKPRRIRLGDQHRRIVRGQSVLPDQPFPDLVGEFRQRVPKSLDAGLGEAQRQEVGVREVAIVVRILLAPHGAGLVTLRIVEARLLTHGLASFDDAHLTAGLDLDRPHQEAHGVEVLEFAPGSKGRARSPHRHVRIGPQRPLFHVAIATADRAQ